MINGRILHEQSVAVLIDLLYQPRLKGKAQLTAYGELALAKIATRFNLRLFSLAGTPESCITKAEKRCAVNYFSTEEEAEEFYRTLNIVCVHNNSTQTLRDLLRVIP